MATGTDEKVIGTGKPEEGPSAPVTGTLDATSEDEKADEPSGNPSDEKQDIPSGTKTRNPSDEGTDDPSGQEEGVPSGNEESVSSGNPSDDESDEPSGKGQGEATDKKQTRRRPSSVRKTSKNPHPLASRLIDLDLHTLVRCSDTGVEGRGCGSLFLYPSDDFARLGDDTRCPHCSGWLQVADASDIPDGIDLPGLAVPFEIEKADAKQRFEEWLTSQHYIPVALQGVVWDYTPVYVAQSWHSWDCSARIAGVKHRSEYDRHNESSYDSWVPYYAVGTGIIPLLAAPDASGLPDERMEVLRPYKVKDKAVPVQENTIPVMPSDSVIELPRKASAEATKESKALARQTFLEGLATEVSMESITAKEIRVTERSDSPGDLSLPVWLVRQRHGDVSFLMNGQTGEVAGDVPMDADARKQFLVRTGGICGGAAVALALITWLAMGGPAYVPSPFETGPDPAVMAWVVLVAVALFSAATIWLIDSRRMEGRKAAEGTDAAGSVEWPGKGIRNLQVIRRKKVGPADRAKEMAQAHAISGFSDEDPL